MTVLRTVSALALLATLCGTVGCAKIESMGRHLDIASEHVGLDKPVYEGHLQSSKKVGAMIAIQFMDGRSFEVVDCPSTLVPGDVVRIYKTEKGYVAHLWKESESQLPTNTLPPAPAPSRNR